MMERKSEQARDALSARRGEISERTGFDQGDMFRDEAQVRAYFTYENMVDMFGADDELEWLHVSLPAPSELTAMADDVIANGWHMVTDQ